MSKEEILAAMTPNLQHYIDGDISPQQCPTRPAARSLRQD
jgi:hypothetical protein